MKQRILFVEDEKILGQLVKESLEKEGFEIKLITNGVDALQAYRDFKPNLCLLDIMLPGKDGYEVATQIRAIDKVVPIIFLTAKIQTADLVAGFNAGCNDYIRKPFSIDEVVVRINSWLAEKYGQLDKEPDAEVLIGDFRFIPGKQELHTPIEVIQLSHKDATILNLLYSHRNTIVSRDHLLQKVWGTDTIYNSRTLDVYINRLRKYFAGSQNKIITLKGVGYRFICE